MSLFRKRSQDPVPPAGVTVLADDGRMYRCDVLREPALDRNGNTGWIAVPVQPLPPGALPVSLNVGRLPGKSNLEFRFGLGDDEPA